MLWSIQYTRKIISIVNHFFIGGLLGIIGIAYCSLVSCVTAEPDLASLTVYSTVYSEGPATLRHGKFHTAAAPGSASEIMIKLSDKRAFATIEGSPIGAVIIVSSTGGTGTFRELALLGKEDNVWVNRDTVFLGDRVKVHSVEIKEDMIIVLISTHAPGDPLCCPSLELKKIYEVRAGILIPVTDAGKTDKYQ